MKAENKNEENKLENNDRNKKATVELIDRLKFIELHFHLDGSITPEIALRLSRIQDISLPTEDLGELKKLLEVPKDCQSLVEFLNHFEIPSKLLQTKVGISECVYCIQEEYKKNNGIYLELRFAPQFHCFKGLTQKEVIEAALEGLRKSDFHANLILCLMRFNNNQKENEETIRLAKEFLVEDNGVVGVDIAGDELGNPITNYKREFELIQKLGIPYTIHAGEADGAISVENSLDLGAKRIGHGFRAAENEKTLKRLVENEVLLEISPLSNFCTNSSNVNNYPFQKLLDAGVKMCINTDDMGIIGNSIKDDYKFLITHYDLTEEQIFSFLYNAIDGAFTSEETKEYLRGLIDEI